MRPTPKSTKTTEKTDITETFLPMYTKSVERLAELQKKTLEFTAQQNNEWMEAWKKATRFAPENPGTFMFELAGQMFDRFLETQRGVINMAVEQSHSAAGVAKDRGKSMGKAAEGITGLFQQAMEQSVAAQKKALDFFAEQQKMAYETAKKQFRFAGNPATEAFQSGLDALIETQKAMLDMASKPLHMPVL
ncbi:MAG TPA: hypothetical protein VMB18_15025 [Terriglobales bacterium]|nr:hypothetical protein [Terriglobales bacterium]